MPFIDDPWIDYHKPIEPEKLHALGCITFFWNACEFKLFELFCATLGVEQGLAWILVHDLGDIAICTRLTAYMDAAPNADKISDVIAVIRNALAAYDICRQNRNQFTHFRLNYDPATEKLSLARQGKTARLERVPFPDSLEDMRRVAREISGLCTYLNDINAFLTRHNTDTPLPLPDKVNLPALIWTPPPQKPPRQRRPRRPSPATRRKVAMGGGG